MHLVLKYNEEKDGNGALRELLEWYDGDAGKSKTPDILWSKLYGLKLQDPFGSSQCINAFNQCIHHLDCIQGDSMSASHKIQIFIRGIEDNDYVDGVLHLRN